MISDGKLINSIMGMLNPYKYKQVSSVLLIFLLITACSQKEIRISSPDNSIAYTFTLKNNVPEYSISYKEKPVVVNAQLSLSFVEKGEYKSGLEVAEPLFREGEEKYDLPVGKTRSVHDLYSEVAIPLRERKGPHRKINLVVRAFNDGIAFRYEIPEQAEWSSFSLSEENTTFRFRGDPKLLALFLPNFTTSHEGPYSSLLLSQVKEDTLMDVPVLFEFPGSVFVCITEAALVDYAGMYLVKHNGIVTSRLSPLPGKSEIAVKSTLPHRSPWRVLMISDRVGTLIESNMITSLNEPCKISDLSWIKPGKCTWPWWNGNVTPAGDFVPGNNFETNKYYIDFCARNGLEYHSVVEYGGQAWYVNDGEGFAPGPNTDVTKPVNGLDMQQVCDYAKEKNVGIRLWVHWAALYPKLDEAFMQYEKWGIRGLMVDFMDRDDQEMIRIQEEILEKAAIHKMHIQFHGTCKPTGLSRTWPNEFTREGAMNYEYNKWSNLVDPDHDIHIPFTRMVAGPVDYHPGGFRAVEPDKYKIQYTEPLVQGTRCHMLAMYVVLESYLGMLCDFPAAYEGQPGFDFLKKVPVTWDETRVPVAELNEFICIARRKGSEWYTGAITSRKKRVIDIPLNFLGAGKYIAEIYTDATDGDPNHLISETRAVSNSDTLTVNLNAGGGMAMHVYK